MELGLQWIILLMLQLVLYAQLDVRFALAQTHAQRRVSAIYLMELLQFKVAKGHAVHAHKDSLHLALVVLEDMY